VLVLTNGVATAVISPWHTTAWREPLDLVYLLVSSAVRVFAAYAVTMYYCECTHIAQGPPEQHLPIETGTQCLAEASCSQHFTTSIHLYPKEMLLNRIHT
jgi:hypothetical protein